MVQEILTSVSCPIERCMTLSQINEVKHILTNYISIEFALFMCIVCLIIGLVIENKFKIIKKIKKLNV